MQRYYDEFRDYSNGTSSGFCDICEGPEFILIAIICLLAIVSLFFVRRIKQKALRTIVYLICITIIISLLNVTKYPGSDILLSAFVICLSGFFGYIALSYVILGLFNFLKEVVNMLRRN